MRELKIKKSKLKVRAGFTLVEAILSSVILSGAVLALGAISTRSLVETKLNRQYEVATALAERQLTWIDYIGVEGFIEMGQTEGEFQGFEPTYHWQVGTEYQYVDNLYLVNMTVSWVDRNHNYSVLVSTMLNGTGGMIETAQ